VHSSISFWSNIRRWVNLFRGNDFVFSSSSVYTKLEGFAFWSSFAFSNDFTNCLVRSIIGIRLGSRSCWFFLLESVDFINRIVLQWKHPLNKLSQLLDLLIWLRRSFICYFLRDHQLHDLIEVTTGLVRSRSMFISFTWLGVRSSFAL
jgi:hypothetical protein